MLIKQELINEYCNEGKSTREIAKEKGYGKSTIDYYLKKYSIPTRTISEARKQLFKRGVLDYHGQGHPLYGKHHTTQAKEKMSKAKENYVPWNKGKKHTKETRELLSGENNPNWKGGISRKYQFRFAEREWAEIAKRVRDRDNYQCQVCAGNGYLVHHIIPYVEIQDDSEENLTTLCRKGHGKIEQSKFQSFWRFYLSKHIKVSLN